MTAGVSSSGRPTLGRGKRWRRRLRAVLRSMRLRPSERRSIIAFAAVLVGCVAMMLLGMRWSHAWPSEPGVAAGDVAFYAGGVLIGLLPTLSRRLTIAVLTSGVWVTTAIAAECGANHPQLKLQMAVFAILLPPGLACVGRIASDWRFFTLFAWSLWVIYSTTTSSEILPDSATNKSSVLDPFSSWWPTCVFLAWMGFTIGLNRSRRVAGRKARQNDAPARQSAAFQHSDDHGG